MRWVRAQGGKNFYSTDFATPTPIAFTTPPPELTLTKYTQKAITKFNIVLNNELSNYY